MLKIIGEGNRSNGYRLTNWTVVSHDDSGDSPTEHEIKTFLKLFEGNHKGLYFNKPNIVKIDDLFFVTQERIAE